MCGPTRSLLRTRANPSALWRESGCRSYTFITCVRLLCTYAVFVWINGGLERGSYVLALGFSTVMMKQKHHRETPRGVQPASTEWALAPDSQASLTHFHRPGNWGQECTVSRLEGRSLTWRYREGPLPPEVMERLILEPQGRREGPSFAPWPQGSRESPSSSLPGLGCRCLGLCLPLWSCGSLCVSPNTVCLPLTRTQEPVHRLPGTVQSILLCSHSFPCSLSWRRWHHSFSTWSSAHRPQGLGAFLPYLRLFLSQFLTVMLWGLWLMGRCTWGAQRPVPTFSPTSCWQAWMFPNIGVPVPERILPLKIHSDVVSFPETAELFVFFVLICKEFFTCFEY